jgi:hypothetical protein
MSPVILGLATDREYQAFGLPDNDWLAWTAPSGNGHARFSRRGLTGASGHREADSLLGAIRSAIRDVRKAGFEPARVEIETDVIEDAAPEGDRLGEQTESPSKTDSLA